MINIIKFFRLGVRRNQSSIIVAVIVGVAMCLLQNTIGTYFNEEYDHMKIAIIDEDKSLLSNSLKAYLKDTVGVIIRETQDKEECSNALLNREISAIINIPKGFEERTVENQAIEQIEISTIDKYANEAYLKAYINGFMSSADLLAQSAGGDTSLLKKMVNDSKVTKDELTIVGATKELTEKSSNIRAFTLIMGFYLNFIFYIGLYIAIMILSDRMDGVLRRMQGTPIKPYQYMIGTTLYSFVIGSLSAVIYTGYLYSRGIEIGIPLWIIAFILIVFVVIVIGISMIIAFLVKSKIGVVFSIYGLGSITTLLGGAFFDTKLAPLFMQRISMIMPQYWIMELVRNVQNFEDYKPTEALLIITMYAILLGLIGLVLFSRQIENCDD